MQLLDQIKAIIHKYKTNIDNLDKPMPNQVLRLLKRGEDMIYQKYRTVKSEFLQLLRDDRQLSANDKKSLQEGFASYRRTKTLVSESAILEQHRALEIKLNKCLIEEDYNYYEANCDELYDKISQLIANDKFLLDDRRNKMYEHLKLLLNQDQDMNHIKSKELARKVNGYYSKNVPVHSTHSVATTVGEKVAA